MQLEKLIANLLKHHYCVIVPDFGGFIANYESAWINRERHLIFPPHKQILFNGNLTKNDGLLANEVALKNAVSYTDALAKISLQIKDWRKQLEEGQRIELDEIGFLFLQNNQVVFEQNREVNLLLQAYGLKQISFVNYSPQEKLSSVSNNEIPIYVGMTEKVVEKDRGKVNKDSVKHNEIPTYVGMTGTKEDSGVGMTGRKEDSVVEVADKKETPVSDTPVIALNTEEEIEVLATEKDDSKVISIAPQKKKSRNYKYAIAAAVILPALFYSYWIPMKTDFLNTGKIQMSDLNPFNKQASSVYETRKSLFNIDLTTDWKSWEELTSGLPENVAVYNYELNDETYVSVRVKDDSLIDPVSNFEASGSYNLIAGCFSIESNATNFVADLNSKGYSSGIVDKKNGLFRVSAGSYATKDEAESALDKFENAGFSGWILKP